jgi:hypothetical protein
MQKMSERTALPGKLKKGRMELDQLKNRERGITRSTEATETKSLSMNFTGNEIKHASACEIKTYSHEVTRFHKDTMNTEESKDSGIAFGGRKIQQVDH